MFLFALGLCCSLVTADISKMESDLEALLNQNSSQSDRALTNMMGPTLSSINGYGCWCYFGTGSHGQGRSKPANDVDAFCRTMANGYDCVIMDNSDECVPWEVDYSSAPQSLENLVEECNARNDNDCAVGACIVEGAFVLKIFQSFISGNQHDSKYLHGNGFNVAEECQVEGGVASEKACCGEHPNRRPFRVMDGNRACCGDRTYDTRALQCCDGNVQFVCA